MFYHVFYLCFNGEFSWHCFSLPGIPPGNTSCGKIRCLTLEAIAMPSAVQSAASLGVQDEYHAPGRGFVLYTYIYIHICMCVCVCVSIDTCVCVCVCAHVTCIKKKPVIAIITGIDVHIIGILYDFVRFNRIYGGSCRNVSYQVDVFFLRGGTTKMTRNKCAQSLSHHIRYHLRNP